MAFFVYIALLAVAMGRWVGVAAAVIGMAMVIGLARVDVVAEATWSRRLRDWMAPGYILAAYWSLEPLARGQESRLYDGYWVQWDRALLYGYGLRPVVELAGPALPFTLELVYLLLYGLPTAMIGWFYYQRRRDRLNDFLEVLFASALLTYALIPLMPSAPPHLEFPHADLPQYLSVIRRLNLWLQKSADITAGVFPSGHVTVGVACWLGFRRAMPQRIGLQRSLFVYVVLLMLATIYGRYHYVVDVVAAVVVSGISFALVERYAPASGVAKRAEVVAAANLV
ncbi:MAG: phosphatase PAP2 family protein [Bryobacteraceae bacterium]|nr:phosphatase PAP2 family protein [Bryobacteraceae bacterium]